MNLAALLQGIPDPQGGQIGTGSHWYPDVQRVGPTPPYIPDSMFQDRIQVAPPNEAAARGLGFDRMDPYERGQGLWAPRAFPAVRMPSR